MKKNYKEYGQLIIISLSVLVIVGSTLVYASRNDNTTSSALEKHAAVCAKGLGNSIHCHSRVIVDNAGQPKTQVTPSGYGPAQLHGAYASQVLAPNKQIIAIVDAYDDPNIFSDLNTYNKTYNIPLLPACSSAVAASLTPCFQKIDQRGGVKYPTVDAGWALEISLDVEMAHAMCQNCSILLIESDSASYTNLMAAVDRAITSGATVVSNSYGSSEFSGETSYDTHFNHPGVAVTFSSGDGGYGVEYPAASQYVTAVGGTTLLLNSDNSYKSESAWSGAGSGCSLYGTKPLWQHDASCINRTVADVSAVADPNTGVAVYDSVRYQGKSGWFKVGGTSLAAPVVAGIYALAGGVSSGVQGASLPYSNGSYLTNIHDILTGSNGTCGGSYLCTATTGFDGPTGLGSPMGISAF
ncbi:MAG: S53 family peptidase [Candidatus Vogelbacteria bacterium]|nr:S53 family peptidase [Candidatus Vogelbacteria bacterium]